MWAYDHTTNLITPAIARALGAEVFENISHLTSLCPEEIINLLSTNMNSKKWLNMFKLLKRC